MRKRLQEATEYDVILSVMDELTHTYADGREVPSYFDIEEITNNYGLSSSEVIDIAENNGYNVYRIPGGENLVDKVVIAHESLSYGDIVKEDTTKVDINKLGKETNDSFNMEEDYMDDAKPFNKKQVYDELKRETNNFTKEDIFRYSFESEARAAWEILSKHYDDVDYWSDDDRFAIDHTAYFVQFKGPKKGKKKVVKEEDCSLEEDKEVQMYKDYKLVYHPGYNLFTNMKNYWKVYDPKGTLVGSMKDIDAAKELVDKRIANKSDIYESAGDSLVGKKVTYKGDDVTIEEVEEDDEDTLLTLSNGKSVSVKTCVENGLISSDDADVNALLDKYKVEDEPTFEIEDEPAQSMSDVDRAKQEARNDILAKNKTYFKYLEKQIKEGIALTEFELAYYDEYKRLLKDASMKTLRKYSGVIEKSYKGDIEELLAWLRRAITNITVVAGDSLMKSTQEKVDALNKRDGTDVEINYQANKSWSSWIADISTKEDIVKDMPKEFLEWSYDKNTGQTIDDYSEGLVFNQKQSRLTSNPVVLDLLFEYDFKLGKQNKNESLEEDTNDEVVEETNEYKIVKTIQHNFKTVNGVARKGKDKVIYQVYFRTQDFNPATNRWMNRGWANSTSDFDSIEDARAYVKKYGKELKEEVKEIQVRDNENIEKDAEECPLPLDVIPNEMGINLSNVEKVKWDEQEDGQLKKVEIDFNPGDDLEEGIIGVSGINDATANKELLKILPSDLRAKEIHFDLGNQNCIFTPLSIKQATEILKNNGWAKPRDVSSLRKQEYDLGDKYRYSVYTNDPYSTTDALYEPDLSQAPQYWFDIVLGQDDLVSNRKTNKPATNITILGWGENKKQESIEEDIEKHVAFSCKDCPYRRECPRSDPLAPQWTGPLRAIFGCPEEYLIKKFGSPERYTKTNEIKEGIEKHNILIDKPSGKDVFEILTNANYNVRKDESKPILTYIINYNDKDYEVINYGWDGDNFFVDLDKSLIDEDIEKHDELNPKLFDGEELKPEIKDKIEQIAYQFIRELNEDGIRFTLKDIVLLGSNVSYNYTKDSDLDIHLIADSSGLECPDDLYPLLYSAYRSMFNKNYDIKIKGIPSEIYVEMDEPQAKSNGIYSLNNGWLKKPEQKDIPDLDESAFDKLFMEWEDKYFNLINGEPTAESIEDFIEDIYDLRKSSIASDGEYGLGNLVFKEFRNLGYLDNLKDLRKQCVSKELSLEHLEEDFSKEVCEKIYNATLSNNGGTFDKNTGEDLSGKDVLKSAYSVEFKSKDWNKRISEINKDEFIKALNELQSSEESAIADSIGTWSSTDGDAQASCGLNKLFKDRPEAEKFALEHGQDAIGSFDDNGNYKETIYKKDFIINKK